MLRLPCLLLAVVLVPGVAGCGATIQPRTREAVPTIGRLPPQPSRPERPEPATATAPHLQAMVQRLCRGAAMPRGWIAVSYEIDEQACPKHLSEQNRYNLVVIQKYSDLPVGALLRVCADQPRPWGWGLEPDREDSADGCPGARVNAGEPTAFVMRRRN